MATKSEQYNQLAADIRKYKEKILALGVTKEFLSDLDGFASQIETFAVEHGEAATAQPTVTGETPIGKLATNETEPTIVNAQPTVETNLTSPAPAATTEPTKGKEPAKTADAPAKS